MFRAAKGFPYFPLLAKMCLAFGKMLFSNVIETCLKAELAMGEQQKRIFHNIRTMAFRKLLFYQESVITRSSEFGYPAVIMFYPIVLYSAHLSPVILLRKSISR